MKNRRNKAIPKRKLKLIDVKKDRKPNCEGKQINIKNIKRKIKEYKEKSLKEKEKIKEEKQKESEEKQKEKRKRTRAHILIYTFRDVCKGILIYK